MKPKHGGAPETPNRLIDPDYRKRKKAENQDFEDRYNDLCGPVTVRRKDQNEES